VERCPIANVNPVNIAKPDVDATENPFIINEQNTLFPYSYVTRPNNENFRPFQNEIKLSEFRRAGVVR